MTQPEFKNARLFISMEVDCLRGMAKTIEPEVPESERADDLFLDWEYSPLAIIPRDSIPRANWITKRSTQYLFQVTTQEFLHSHELIEALYRQHTEQDRTCCQLSIEDEERRYVVPVSFNVTRNQLQVQLMEPSDSTF